MECLLNNKPTVVIVYILTEGTTNYHESAGNERFHLIVTLPHSLWNVDTLFFFDILASKKLYIPVATFIMFATNTSQIKNYNSAVLTTVTAHFVLINHSLFK
jgi:hypothetical protein